MSSEHSTHAGVHKDTNRMTHLFKTVDRISNVLTADLIVDFGVFLTGVTLVFLELGLVSHRPFEDHPPQEAVVRRVDSASH